MNGFSSLDEHKSSLNPSFLVNFEEIARCGSTTFKTVSTGTCHKYERLHYLDLIGVISRLQDVLIPLAIRLRIPIKIQVTRQVISIVSRKPTGKYAIR